MREEPIVIIGAGPAGLTAALELVNAGRRPIVLEKAPAVGGLARTEVYKGYRFDIGGHRFFTKVQAVDKLWRRMLGEDFIEVKRLSRIYYRGRFYSYPLDALNALRNLGLIESVRIAGSYAWIRLRPLRREDTFEEWVTNRFGRRLYQTFFKTYTEKVWGIPCSQIQADWAAQRIKGLSLLGAAVNAIFGSTRGAKTLIKSFHYPLHGPGMMWQRFTESIEADGGQVRLNTGVQSVAVRDGRVVEVTAQSHLGMQSRIAAQHVISTMPISELVRRLDPAPPAAVLEAARGLKYRAFILVGLILDRADVFPDNWIYVHNPQVKVGRIQNFKNWSPAMVPDASKTCLGMEYFCGEGDELWSTPDRELIDLASREVVAMGLAKDGDVIDGVVVRQPKAYPVYDGDYRGHLAVLQQYLGGIANLQTIGRNGMHRYNNQDHSMLTAMLAVKRILGEEHDLWQVNTERSYYETFTKAQLQESAE